MGRLMDDVWPPLAPGNGGTWVPLAHIEETNNAWIVESELASVDRKDVNLELRDSELVISGEITERSAGGAAPADRQDGALRVPRGPPRPTRRRARRGQDPRRGVNGAGPAEGSRRRRKDVKGGPSVSAVAQRRQPEPWAWRRSGQSLVRELAFRDFDQAIAFVEQLASVAENHLHRPNM